MAAAWKSNKMAGVAICLCPLLLVNMVVANVLSELDDKKCTHDKSLDLDVKQTQGFFYDFQNIHKLNGSLEELVRLLKRPTVLDTSKRLLLFVPGYNTAVFGETDKWAVEAFKSIPDTNLVIISYAHYIKDPFNVTNYLDAVNYVYYIGKAVGEFLAKLHMYGYPAENIHCIGHSLGGQVLSYIGETFTQITGNRVWRLTGLDAARPCFEKSSMENQLRSGTAEYVEAYHCTAYASKSKLADTEFYVNLEVSVQPGCEGGRKFPESGQTNELDCSHYMCLINWLQSVSDPNCYQTFDSYEDYLEDDHKRKVAVGGYYNPGNETGEFYIHTQCNNMNLSIFLSI